MEDQMDRIGCDDICRTGEVYCRRVKGLIVAQPSRTTR